MPLPSLIQVISLPLICILTLSLLNLALLTTFLACSILFLRALIIYFQLLTAILPYYLFPYLSRVYYLLISDDQSFPFLDDEISAFEGKLGEDVEYAFSKKRRRRSSSSLGSGSITPTLLSFYAPLQMNTSPKFPGEVASQSQWQGGVKTSRSLTQLAQRSTAMNPLAQPFQSKSPQVKSWFHPPTIVASSSGMRDFEGVGGWELACDDMTDELWIGGEEVKVRSGGYEVPAHGIEGVERRVIGKQEGVGHRRRRTDSFSSIARRDVGSGGGVSGERNIVVNTGRTGLGDMMDDEVRKEDKAQESGLWKGSGIWEGVSSRSRSPEEERRGLGSCATIGSNIGKARRKS